MQGSKLSRDAATTQRGQTASAPKVAPLATGLVLGLGGTGIQTVARVRSMIADKFPEALKTSALTFLGVDSVTADQQNPPLPPGVGLPSHEFFNLTSTRFEPSQLVEIESLYGSPLTKWWDFQRGAPSGALLDGFKQDRMVGRLAYYRDGAALASRIGSALRQTSTITTDHLQRGVAGTGDGGAPRVYVIASMCGGTGSAGVLEVLYRIWQAAQAGGMSPEIRLFLLMPGLFELEIERQSVAPEREIPQLRANAYGFLRELDHFLRHGNELGEQVANPDPQNAISIPANDLVKQVYLVDARMNSGNHLESLQDAYEVVALAIHQMLMTAAGGQMAANSTNIDDLLLQDDRYGKRRIYCGLGIHCITYPGETLRQYLTYRLADWVIQERLLAKGTADASERARSHPVTENLLTRLTGLHREAVEFELSERVRSFRRDVTSAPGDLAIDQTDDYVRNLVGRIRNARPIIIDEYRHQLESHGKAAQEQIDAAVVDALVPAGEGVPLMQHVLRHVRIQLKSRLQESQSWVSTHQAAVAASDAAIEAASKKLSERPKWHEWLGLTKAPARELGEALASYGTSTMEELRMRASERFYEEAIAALEQLGWQLERAASQLGKDQQTFAEIWHNDELVGKDAGPRGLTSLIPSDVQPEVEDSQLARDSWTRMMLEFSQVSAQDLLQNLYAKWRGQHQGRSRAVFDLGVLSNDRIAAAREDLFRLLEELIDEHALQVQVPDEDANGESNEPKIHLPRSLAAASGRTDQGASLELALQSFATLTDKVLLSVSVNRLGFSGGLSPATVISRPRDLAAEISQVIPDTVGRKTADWPDKERVQAMVTMWGASAHALDAVPTWRSSYLEALERVAEAKRRPDKHNARSPHLSDKWQAELDELEPNYLDYEAAAETVVEARLSSLLLEDPVVKDEVFGPSPQDYAAGKPFELVDLGTSTAWRAKYFNKDTNRRWAATGAQTDMPGDLDDVLDRVARDAAFRTNNDAFSEAVFKAAGTQHVLTAAQEFKAKLEETMNAEFTQEEVKAAVRLLLRELSELIQSVQREINKMTL